MIFTIAVLFMMGGWYYLLAQKHEQNKWLFGALGIGVYYLGTFIYGLVLVKFIDPLTITKGELNSLRMLGIPAGMLFAGIVYGVINYNLKLKQAEKESE